MGRVLHVEAPVAYCYGGRQSGWRKQGEDEAKGVILFFSISNAKPPRAYTILFCLFMFCSATAPLLFRNNVLELAVESFPIAVRTRCLPIGAKVLYKVAFRRYLEAFTARWVT